MGQSDISSSENMPKTLEEGMAMQAVDFVNAFSAPGAPIDGSQLNFSATSLQLVDQVLNDFYLRQVPLPDDLHFLISAYIFETVRRVFGGRYMRDEAPDEFVLVIGEPEFDVGICVMSKVLKRVANGSQDSIVAFYEGIAPYMAQKANEKLD